MKARPTIYNGILMRSRLEARVAHQLDLQGLDWTYEPRNFKSRTGVEYLPDFKLVDGGHVSYWEVKGPPLTTIEREAVQRRMQVIWEYEPKADLFLSLCGNHGQLWAAFPGYLAGTWGLYHQAEAA